MPGVVRRVQGRIVNVAHGVPGRLHHPHSSTRGGQMVYVAEDDRIGCAASFELETFAIFGASVRSHDTF